MTGNELAALIVASASLLTALGGFVVQVATLFRMSHVEKSVNGHSEALNALTGKAAYAEGLLAGSTVVGERLVDAPADSGRHSDLPEQP